MKYLIIEFNGADWDITTWKGMMFYSDEVDAINAFGELKICYPYKSFILYQKDI